MTVDPSAAYPAADLRNLVTDDEWERLTRIFGTSGVDIADGGSALAATLSASPRAVNLTPGGCFVAGRYRPPQPSTEQVPIPAANGQDRIDRAVMRLDRQATTQEAIITPVIVTGTPAANPTPPTLLSTAQYLDIPVAQYRARANGAIDTLLDERRFTGMPYRSAPTGIGVPSSTPVGSLWWQSNRARLTVKNDTAGSHIVVAEDSGWVELTGSYGWYAPVEDSKPAVRAKNGVGFFAGAVKRTTGTLPQGDNDSRVLQIPPEFRPSRWHTTDCTFANEVLRNARLVLDTDGWLRLQHPDGTFPVGTYLYIGQASGWPIG